MYESDGKLPNFQLYPLSIEHFLLHRMKHLILLLVACTLLGCNSEKKNIAEAPPLTDSLDVQHNTLYFTIDYPTKDLEDWLNRKFDKVIVDKDIPRDNKDSVRIVITKPNKIRLNIVGDSVDVLFPLQIEVIADKEKKSGKIKERRVTGDLDLHLNIKPDVNAQWDIIAKSVLKNHEWKKKPTLRMGNTEVGVKFILDHILRKEVNTLTENLDKALEEKVNLKKGINKTWQNIQKPMPIVKQDSSLLYFKIDPTGIAGDIKVLKSGFLFKLAVGTRALVHVDSLTLSGGKPLPPFRKLGKFLPDSNRLEVLAKIPLRYINHELVDLLLPYDFQNKVMKLTVKNINMRGSQEKIVLGLGVDGTAEGQITIVGQPVYHADRRILSIKELDYDLESDNVMVKLLDKNLKENLLSYVQEKVVLDVGKYVTNLPEYLNNTINQGRTADKFHLNFEEIQVEDLTYVINEDELQIKLRCKPKFDLSLKRLPVKKKLKIR